VVAAERNEQELISAARNGDQTAFKEIIHKYQPRVAATVFGMLGHCTEAEDIGQETFIQFYKSLERFRGDSSLATYLTRIAINLSINELRKRKKKMSTFASSARHDLEHIPDSRHPGPDRDVQRMVRKAVQKLEPKFRKVVVLRMINGYTVKETAQILNLPAGTVLSRLARAQTKLRTSLKPLLGDKP
jgi:RNA polymerase sigma-70 factor (ECF subfamily)